MTENNYNDDRRRFAARVKKCVLENFKSVGHGEIVLDSVKNINADILGIYGQNGSGKTTIIEAFGILKKVMSGDSVPLFYSECVSKGYSYSKLLFTFDIEYDEEISREVTYTFCIREEDSTQENQRFYDEMLSQVFAEDLLVFQPSIDRKVVVFNEEISIKWENSKKRQVVIDTSSENKVFVPDTKCKQLIGTNKNLHERLLKIKNEKVETGESFVFSRELIDAIKQESKESIYYEVLEDLKLFATYALHVVDNKSFGAVQTNMMLPLYLFENVYQLSMARPQKFEEGNFKNLLAELSRLNVVLNEIIPGLKIGYKVLDKSIEKDGRVIYTALLSSYRGDIEIPFRNESDGARKIVSVLNLLVLAFNYPITVVIDELDAGIYEFLLGELLQAFEEAGQGQLIFTSHNLRPLEVLNKKHLCFTTTNRDNRFIKLKGIAETNNLRNTYFREIIMGEQDECLYHRTKKVKLISAFRKVEEV